MHKKLLIPLLMAVIVIAAIGVGFYFGTKSGTTSGMPTLGKMTDPPTLEEVKQYCAAMLNFANIDIKYKVPGKSWATDVQKIDAYGDEMAYTIVMNVDPANSDRLEGKFMRSEKGWFLDFGPYPCTIPR